MLNAIVVRLLSVGFTGIASALLWHDAVILHAAEPDIQSTAGIAAHRESAWEAVFSRTQGWNGGDVAGTVDLGDGRVVWLFGDTFVGPLADGKRLPGTVMINNSLAVHAWNPASPRPPTPDAIEFVFGKPDAEGKPTAVFAPQRVPPNELDNQLDAMRQFWPSGGGVVVETAGKRQLIVGLFVIRKTKEQGAFAFRRVGNAFGIIDDVRHSPAEWRGRVVDIPHAVGDQAQTEGVASLSWGEQFLRIPNDQANVYVFGVRAPLRGPRELVAARVPADSIEAFEKWRFYTSDGHWSGLAAEAGAILKDIAPEFSLERLDFDAFHGYLLVQNEPLLGAGIRVLTAEEPFGPWSTPRAVFRPMLPPNDRDLFSYAAKGHLLLSCRGELLISYIVSAHDFWRLFRQAELYRPRFVSVPLGDVVRER